MQYRINFIDNQGQEREKIIHASTFSEAVSILEAEALEIGYGIAGLTIVREAV